MNPKHFFTILSATTFFCAEETSATYPEWDSKVSQQSSSIYQPSEPTPTPPPAPWFTGGLIPLTGYIVPYGNVEIEVYNYANVTTGSYDADWNQVSAPNFYQYALQVYGYFGLTAWMDLLIYPQLVVNTTQNKTSSEFCDLPVALEFMAFDSNANSPFPGIKLSFRETFPTGRFEELNPHRLGTQASGAGTFASSAALFFYKQYNTNGNHFLAVNCNFTYTVNTPVNVHGFNAYGGGYGCSGKVLPGSSMQAIASFEYNLTQNWVLAIDNVYTHTFETVFYGNPGTLSDGSPATVGSPTSDWLAFAPQIEYNFSASAGINLGAYVTAFGRNAPIFRNGIVEFVYNY